MHLKCIQWASAWGRYTSVAAAKAVASTLHPSAVSSGQRLVALLFSCLRHSRCFRAGCVPARQHVCVLPHTTPTCMQLGWGNLLVTQAHPQSTGNFSCCCHCTHPVPSAGPAAFPVEVSTDLNGPTEECLTAGSTCSGGRPFSLVDGENVAKCVNDVLSTDTCSMPGFSGLEIFSPDGNKLIGCTVDSQIKCPILFPIGFYNAGVLERCRGSLAGGCPAIGTASLRYPVPVYRCVVQ